MVEKIDLTSREIDLLKKYLPNTFGRMTFNGDSLIYDDDDFYDEVFLELNSTIVEHGLTPDQNHTTELGRELYIIHDKIF